MHGHEVVSLGPQLSGNKPGEAVHTCNAMVGSERQADLWGLMIRQCNSLVYSRPVREPVLKKKKVHSFGGRIPLASPCTCT